MGTKIKNFNDVGLYIKHLFPSKKKFVGPCIEKVRGGGYVYDKTLNHGFSLCINYTHLCTLNRKPKTLYILVYIQVIAEFGREIQRSDSRQ